MYLIGLIIAENKGRSQYYTASVKPFVDIAFGLKKIGIESVLFIPYSEEQLVPKLLDVTHNQVEIVFYKKSNLKMKLEGSKVKYIMIDDNISAMNRVLSLHLEKVKTIVYTQYLFGINSNRSNLRRKSVKLLIASFLPWMLLTYFYRRSIAKFDFIIANSRTCEYLLDKFYDLQSSGVVYPPVGVDMRELIPQNKESAKKEGVLIFVGNSKNDFFLRDLRLETLRLKKELKEPIRILATDEETAELYRRLDFEVFSKIPVSELVLLLKNSRITYVPTTFELFGHVGAESLICGTPVILDTYHPFLELVPKYNRAVKIASTNLSIATQVLSIIEDNAEICDLSNEILEKYSPEKSAMALLGSLNIKANI